MRKAFSRPNGFTASSDPRYLTAGEIRQRFGGVSLMWIVRRTKFDGFPTPIKFTRSRTGPRFWLLTEIEQWEQHYIARSRGCIAKTVPISEVPINRAETAIGATAQPVRLRSDKAKEPAA